MAALASLIVFGAAVGGTAPGAGSRAAGAWFDAFDQNGDGEWGEDEVAALACVLANKIPLEAQTAADISAFRPVARKYLRESAESPLKRSLFVKDWSAGEQSGVGQVRVTTPAPSTATITWAHDTPEGHTPCLSFCQGGVANCADPRVLDGQTWSYSVPKRWWDAEGAGDVSLHGVVVTSLSPGARYSYSIGTRSSSQDTGACQTNSSAFKFSTPFLHNATAPSRFAVVGDAGSYQLFGFKVIESMKAKLPSFDPTAVFIIGDVAYAGIATNIKPLNITSDDEFEPFWNVYGNLMTPIAASYPLFASHGNHDAFYDSIAYKARYSHSASLPPPMAAAAPTYYGQDVGQVHFTVLDSEVDYSPGSPMYAFVEQDLQQAAAARDAGVGPSWLVLINHRPLVSSDRNELQDHLPNSTRNMYLQPLMLKHGVDLVLVGHQHGYERVHPNVNGTVVSKPTMKNGVLTYYHPGAPVHVLVGTGGAVQEETWVKPQPDWSAFRGADLASEYGYAAVTAFNQSHLHCAFVPVKQGDRKPDSFFIAR